VRDAARTIQAVVATARERAAEFGEATGVRFVQSKLGSGGDPEVAKSLLLVKQADPVVGFARVDDRPGNVGIYDAVYLIGTPDEVGLITGAIEGLPTNAAGEHVGAIRFGKAGRFHGFRFLSSFTNGKYGTSPYLLLAQPFTHVVPDGTKVVSNAILPTGSRLEDRFPPLPTPPFVARNYGVEFEIEIGTVPIEDADPILLPDDVVIDFGSLASTDVRKRLSRISPSFPYDPSQPNRPFTYDILFSAAGSVVGTQAQHPQIILWLHNLSANTGTIPDPADNTQTRKVVRVGDQGTHALVTVYARTGLASVFQPEFNDDGSALSNTDAAGNGVFDPEDYFLNVNKGTGSGL
ncbi:MAG: hypothetical protein ACRDD1_03730, partial [Planctomycetia bacterium]